MSRLVQTREWIPVSESYRTADRLPSITPIVGDRVGYACGPDGFDPLHPDDALCRLKEGKRVFWTSYMECETPDDEKTARAIRRWKRERSS
jgi:hypothetical protein